MSNNLLIKINLRFLIISDSCFFFLQIASSDSGFDLEEFDNNHKLNDGRSHVDFAPEKSPERVDQANAATSVEAIFYIYMFFLHWFQRAILHWFQREIGRHTLQHVLTGAFMMS